MRLFLLLLLATLLGAGSAPAQNLLADKNKAKTKTVLLGREPAKGKLKVVTKKPAAAKPATKKVEAVPVIVFKRTPCFGTCPHYEATIFSDGHVTYIGYRYVPLTGPHELKLPVATVNTILDEARRLNFATYEERYSQGSTDLPATILSIRQPNGQLKTVQAEEGTPPELEAFMKSVAAEIEKVSGGTTAADR
ncbi:DUF6438 domain-containing protein [Hymenobacter chitinivorans]|uniref:DUF6438 domain-containing protein n=1 Tax=Hymenobacter chitinivorans DSM 11115 TaxID=1121954 RepID=A0A2M9AQS4_9BACT|nr:DUF6438 domain-containing protein [Hymenobacter chitinivorans]PJJ48054.1 hypothetical protein CLV45_4747 [Hymenobacter chitinivorans DSM 11115]